MYGFTDNYLKVSMNPNPDLANKIVSVHLDSMEPDGELVNGTITS